MGKLKGPYEAEFPVGSAVQIAEPSVLEEFGRSWSYHNPLQAEQVKYAGRRAVVTKVGYYHGGDELYSLAGIPGIWHEACLSAVEQDT